MATLLAGPPVNILTIKNW